MRNHEPMAPVLAGYAAEAAALIPRYEGVSAAEKLRHVAHLLPAHPALVADIGAGTGVDAAWLAAQGHSVLAVEPTQAFRDAGERLHRSERIEWLDDTLPALEKTLARAQARFQFVLLSAVWAHLPPQARAAALSNIDRLMAPGATLVLSLRQGPSPASRPTYPADVEQTIELARARSLQAVLQISADSVQAANRAAGVVWHWLAFRKTVSRGA